MLRPGDAEFLAQGGLSAVEISSHHGWPALDFEADQRPFTVLYGLDTDVFVIRARDTDELWEFTYGSDREAMLAYIRGWGPSGPAPLDTYAVRYLAAILLCETRQTAPSLYWANQPAALN